MEKILTHEEIDALFRATCNTLAEHAAHEVDRPVRLNFTAAIAGR